MQLETVRVCKDNAKGYRTINRSDMKPGDKVYVEPKPKKGDVSKSSPAEE